MQASVVALYGLGCGRSAGSRAWAAGDQLPRGTWDLSSGWKPELPALADSIPSHQTTREVPLICLYLTQFLVNFQKVHKTYLILWNWCVRFLDNDISCFIHPISWHYLFPAFLLPKQCCKEHASTSLLVQTTKYFSSMNKRKCRVINALYVLNFDQCQWTAHLRSRTLWNFCQLWEPSPKSSPILHIIKHYKSYPWHGEK